MSQGPDSLSTCSDLANKLSSQSFSLDIMVLSESGQIPWNSTLFWWNSTLFCWNGTLFWWNGTLFWWNGTLFWWNGTLFGWNCTLFQWNGTLFWWTVPCFDETVLTWLQRAMETLIRSYTFKHSIFSLQKNRKSETDNFVSELFFPMKFTSLHFAHTEKGISHNMNSLCSNQPCLMTMMAPDQPNGTWLSMKAWDLLFISWESFYYTMTSTSVKIAKEMGY